GPLDERRAACLVLERTSQPVPCVERVGGEGEVSDLAGAAVGPDEQLIVHDQAHAHPRTDGDEGEGRDALAETVPLLSERRRAPVVVDQHGGLQLSGEYPLKVDALEAGNVGGQADLAGVRVLDFWGGGDH